MTSHLPPQQSLPGHQSPGLPGLGRVAGVPTELLIAAGLFAAPAVYLIVSILRGLPDIIDLFDFSARFGFLILWFLIVALSICGGLLAIAGLLLKFDRVGRGLAFLVAGEWVLAVIASKQRSTAEVITMICLLLAAVVLAVSPVLQAHFRIGRERNHPVSINMVRVMLMAGALAWVSIGLLYLIASVGVDGLWKLTVLGFVFLLVGPVAYVGAQYLAQGNRTARVVISLVVGALFVLGLVFGGRSFAEIQAVSMAVVLPVCLWLTPDAREFFGDPPLPSLVPAQLGVTDIALGQSPSPSGGSPRAAPRSVATHPFAPPVDPAPSIACGHCGASTDPEDAFCRSCGAAAPVDPPAVRHCPHCQKELEVGDAFCSGCGQPVAAPTVELLPPQPVERRCGSCASVLGSDDRFCFSCGYAA